VFVALQQHSHSNTYALKREGEREKKVGGGSERHYRFGGGCNRNNLAVWKVPRQCPLVLLVKDLFNFDLKDVGASVVGEM
jgi:hypothetical protein